MSEAALALLGCFAVLELVLRGGITRRVWFEIVRFFAAFEMAMIALVRLAFPPRYRVLGSCVKCGSCCRQIVADPPRVMKRGALLWLFLAYHRVMHNFEVVGRGPEHDELVFSCGHLGTDGRCGIYWRRPFLCRAYPHRPYFVAPELLPDCSFAVAHRSVARMRRRVGLPLLAAGVSVHHPTRDHKGESLPRDYEWVDES